MHCQCQYLVDSKQTHNTTVAAAAAALCQLPGCQQRSLSVGQSVGELLQPLQIRRRCISHRRRTELVVHSAALACLLVGNNSVARRRARHCDAPDDKHSTRPARQHCISTHRTPALVTTITLTITVNCNNPAVPAVSAIVVLGCKAGVRGEERGGK